LAPQAQVGRFLETYSGRRFFDSSQMRSKLGLKAK
jgi:hypothetical protein